MNQNSEKTLFFPSYKGVITRSSDNVLCIIHLSTNNTKMQYYALQHPKFKLDVRLM